MDCINHYAMDFILILFAARLIFVYVVDLIIILALKIIIVSMILVFHLLEEVILLLDGKLFWEFN